MHGAIQDLSSLSFGGAALLVFALLAACAFEFINGFHDTANAVATVIYTNTLKPRTAVIYSGALNFLGVFLGGIAVALAVIKLLPVELLVEGRAATGLAMVLALLFAAIIWNLGTWYLGLPASSSHTLIGAILGVGITHSWMSGHLGDGVSWHKATEVGLSLLLSPVIGFVLAAVLVRLMRRIIRDKRVFGAPSATSEEPPRWVRALLVLTCGGVSFAHGSNDGQKGVGLMMLILVGLLPASFALDRSASPDEIAQALAASNRMQQVFDAECRGQAGHHPACIASAQLRIASTALGTVTSIEQLDPESRWAVRKAVLEVDDAAAHLGLSEQLSFDREQLGALTDYAPWWILMLVAGSLGLGTMVGWRRIVITVGEKIGRTHLSYAQGAAAELVAMTTIGLSSMFGLPVSTTHVLSSGVAGTMASEGSGLQPKTVKHILLAWVLTLPASLVLASVLFFLFESLIG